jgi:hypothetical protein
MDGPDEPEPSRPEKETPMVAKNPAAPGPWFSGENDDTNPQPSVGPKLDPTRGKDPEPDLGSNPAPQEKGKS